MVLGSSHLTEEQLTLVSKDETRGVHSRQWYVDGQPYDTIKTMVYNADMDADSVAVMLVVCNDGCCDSAMRSVPVWHEYLAAPNMFAPKGSSEANSRWRVVGGCVTDFEVSVFNRRGLRVFHSRDKDAEWDGNHNNAPCPGGNYVYVVRYSTCTQPTVRKQMTGSVVLLR